MVKNTLVKIMKKSAAFICVLAVGMSYVLTACTPQNPQRDTFVLGDTSFNPENEEPGINPHEAYSGWAALRYGVGETLVRYDENMNVVPWLAAHIENVDPLTWRVDLKKGVKFSSGRTMDSYAVKENFDALVASHPRAAGDLKIASIEVEGNAVIFHTSEPRPTFVNYLADPYAAIIDMKAHVSAQGMAVGTGPYAAVRLESGKSLVLEPNRYYWGETPGFKKITIVTITDGDTLAMALQSGEINAAYGLAYSSYPLWEKKEYTISRSQTSRSFFLTMNFDSPLTSDPAVRRAIAMGIDKKKFSENILGGNGTPAAGPFPSTFDFGREKTKAQPYDPAQARAVLEHAGWHDSDGDGVREKEGKKLEIRWLTYPSRQELPLLAQMAQGDLADIGIRVKITTSSEHTSLRKNLSSWDVYASAMVTAPTGDPEYFFTTHALDSSVANWGNFSDMSVNKSAERLSQAFSPHERAALGQELAQKVIDTDAFVFITWLDMGLVAQSWVEGLRAFPCDYYEISSAVRAKNGREDADVTDRGTGEE